jgi:uncharacterized protein (TIGR02145 family)
MTRKLLFVFLAITSTAILQAQTDFAHDFNSGGGMAGNVSFSYGNLFYSQPANTNLSASEGVMHAQLIRKDMELAGCQNSGEVSPTHVKDTSRFFLGYDGEEIIFDGNTIHVFPAGIYDSTGYDALHYNWDAQYNYDSLTTLMMYVWPIYELWDTLYLDSTEIVTDYAHNVLHIPTSINQPLHGGPNKYYLLTNAHDCDSIQHFYVNLCGGLVADGNGNKYPSLYVGEIPHRYCWTGRNMHNTLDSYGNDVPNMIYSSPTHPNIEQNLDTYGRLYTWYAAVGLPENSEDQPATTTNGSFVTGICPKGWHIPDRDNITSLTNLDAFTIMADSLWLIPGNNATGFNALPAGFYNPFTGRFENLLGHTSFWSSSQVNHKIMLVCTINFGCDIISEDERLGNYGLSVRCVKNQVFDNDGNELND